MDCLRFVSQTHKFVEIEVKASIVLGKPKFITFAYALCDQAS
jgi:hypothetical protein